MFHKRSRFILCFFIFCFSFILNFFVFTGNSDKLNVEIHLPKIEPNEMIKTRAAYVGGYLAMKTLMEIEEYVLNMMF